MIAFRGYVRHCGFEFCGFTTRKNYRFVSYSHCLLYDGVRKIGRAKRSLARRDATYWNNIGANFLLRNQFLRFLLIKKNKMTTMIRPSFIRSSSFLQPGDTTILNTSRRSNVLLFCAIGFHVDHSSFIHASLLNKYKTDCIGALLLLLLLLKGWASRHSLFSRVLLDAALLLPC